MTELNPGRRNHSDQKSTLRKRFSDGQKNDDGSDRTIKQNI